MSDDESEEELVSHLLSQSTTLINIILPSILQTFHKTPARTSSLTGNLYYEHLINHSNGRVFREVARMDKPTFVHLKKALEDSGKIKTTRNICTGEKLMIFLFIITGNSNRTAQERWQHSGETITRVLYEAMNALMCIHPSYIRPPSSDVPRQIQSDSRFFPYFKDCIGALDGTHIPAVVPASYATPFQNRKGFTSQNVLAVCDFNLVFTYVLSGWEGAAHDGRVLQDALTKGFPLRAGKYYLGDAGYPLTSYTLTPYRGVRYHLKEWTGAANKPRNQKELFNLRHASLRNAIERIFGVMKKRFPILCSMPSYPIQIQSELVICICIVHNFIRRHQRYNDTFDELQNEEGMAESDDNHEHTGTNDNEASVLRDRIASAMWADYENMVDPITSS